MTSKVADSIRRGLEEAIAYAECTAGASRYGVHIPEEVNVKATRAKPPQSTIRRTLRSRSSASSR
jgi:putative transcriptional regulator